LKFSCFLCDTKQVKEENIVMLSGLGMEITLGLDSGEPTKDEN